MTRHRGMGQHTANLDKVGYSRLCGWGPKKPLNQLAGDMLEFIAVNREQQRSHCRFLSNENDWKVRVFAVRLYSGILFCSCPYGSTLHPSCIFIFFDNVLHGAKGSGFPTLALLFNTERR